MSELLTKNVERAQIAEVEALRRELDMLVQLTVASHTYTCELPSERSIQERRERVKELEQIKRRLEREKLRKQRYAPLVIDANLAPFGGPYRDAGEAYVALQKIEEREERMQRERVAKKQRAEAAARYAGEHRMQLPLR